MPRRRKIEIKASELASFDTLVEELRPDRSLRTSTRQVCACGHTRITNRQSEILRRLSVISIIGWRRIETKCSSRHIRAVDYSARRIWPRLWVLRDRRSIGGLRTAGWKNAPCARFRMAKEVIRRMQYAAHWRN